MQIPTELKNVLIKLKTAIPAERQAQFASNVREHLEALEMDDMVGCTIAGALVGTVCEILPLDTITGIHDWVEIGATLGAWIGYARSTKERKLRKEIQRMIEEELRHALAH
jgi:hypothetical protein